MKASFLAFFGALALVACGQQSEQDRAEAPKPPQASREREAGLPAGCVLGPNEKIGGPISLVDHSGRAVTEADFAEAPSLIYFGFTFCPDICPLTLQKAKESLTELGPEGGMIQPVLISLDPERDTPDAMAAYVESQAFPEGLLGLTGAPADTAAAAKAFKVGWQKSSDPSSAAPYVIDHTSFLYLMDEEWRLLSMYPSTLSPGEGAQCLKAGLARAGAG